MSDDFDVKGALEHNRAEFLEKGPGLRYTTRSAIRAKCPSGKHVLKTGLGAMGCGSMWFEASSEVKAAPEWEKLTVEECGQCPSGTVYMKGGTTNG